MQPESISSSDEALTGDTENNASDNCVERRKSSKPIMEKKRRARINSSLEELKKILLAALKRDSTRHSKLEKADILEMTVKYLKHVERQRLSVSLSIDPSIVDKYRAGFTECRNEVTRFLSTCEGVTVDVRTSMLNHLASCIQSIQNQSCSTFEETPFELSPPVHRVYLPNRNASKVIPVHISDGKTADSSATDNTSKSSNSFKIPGLDSKTAILQSEIFNTSSTQLQEGLQLKPTISSYAGDNVAFILSPASLPTALFDPETNISSSNIIANQNQSVITGTYHQRVGKSSPESVKENNSTQQSNMFAVENASLLKLSPQYQQQYILNFGGRGPAISNAGSGLQAPLEHLSWLRKVNDKPSQLGVYDLNRSATNPDMNISSSSNEESAININEGERIFCTPDDRVKHQEAKHNEIEQMSEVRTSLEKTTEDMLISSPNLMPKHSETGGSEYLSTASSRHISGSKRRAMSNDFYSDHSLSTSNRSPSTISPKRERWSAFYSQEASPSLSPPALYKNISNASVTLIQDIKEDNQSMHHFKHVGDYSEAKINVKTAVKNIEQVGNVIPVSRMERWRDFNNNKAISINLSKTTKEGVYDVGQEARTVSSQVKSSPWRPWSTTELVDT